MNNIFDGSSSVGINLLGQDQGNIMEYNLFYANTVNIVQTSNIGVTNNVGAVFANPEFVGPIGTGDAGAQNFELEPTSPAINASRSEIGPIPAGNAIFPTTTLVNYTGTGGNTCCRSHEPGKRQFPPGAGTNEHLVLPEHRSEPDRHAAWLGLLQLPG